MGGKDRQSDAEPQAGRGISRRKVLAGGLMFVGGSSFLVKSDTDARFSDSGSASGDVQVASLKRMIEDQSDPQTNSVQYRISWKVEMDSGFDRIEVTLDNTSNDVDQTWEGDKEGSETWISDHGVKEGHEYEFTFEVYVQGENDSVLVFDETVPDVPDGENPSGNDDLSSPDDPEFNWILVDDITRANDGARYDLYYQVARPDRFDRVEAMFQNEDSSSATQTPPPSYDQSIGKIEYRMDHGDGDSYEINAQVYNDSGYPVASQSFEDTAGGDDYLSYGDPVRSDSPKLDSFTITDRSQNNEGTQYALEYEVSNTDRFDHVEILFADIEPDENWASERTSRDAEPMGEAMYPISPDENHKSGTYGHQYEMTVRVYEEREGYVFPVDSGTLTDTADGSDEKTWPEDAN